jgi:hypothetical protein
MKKERGDEDREGRQRIKRGRGGGERGDEKREGR